MKNFDRIGALPAPSSSLPSLPSGTVIVYRDSNWKSQRHTVRTSNHRENVRHTFTGDATQDAVTWIAFNLPLGTVMTLTEHCAEQEEGYPVWNLRHCGRVVDLIGTGATEAVDLGQCHMNGGISAFFWRRVNLQVGAIELFEHAGFSGNRTVLFLDEWSFGITHSLQDWHIKNRLGSARWHSLDSTVAVSLFNSDDGSGSSYHNIMDWSGSKQLANFRSISFNDVLSAFRWEGLPKIEDIPDECAVAHGATMKETFAY